MKVALAQLSDIHLTDVAAANPVLGRADAVVRAVIASVPTDCRHFIVVVSGDTAFSGKPSEYALGAKLIGAIRSGLGKHPQFAGRVKVVVIPGNHDCLVVPEDSVRGIVIKSLATNPTDGDVITTCVKAQADYFSFASGYDGSVGDPKDAIGQLHKTVTFDCSGKQVVLHLLNSAWVSVRKEAPGTLQFPVPLVRERIAASSPGDLAVSVIHHPFNWFVPETGRELRRCLEDHSDLILTGHEHVSEAFAKRTYTGQSNEYLAGGVLQETGQPEVSSFNLVVFDLASQRQWTRVLEWDGTLYRSEAEPEWRPFARNQRLTSQAFTFTAEFDRFLDDPGAGYTHPQKDSLTLSDVFVYPDLEDAGVEGDRAKRSVVPGRDIVSRLHKTGRSLIIGDEKTGKSPLSKRLLTDFHRFGLVPVLLQGEEIDNYPTEERLRRSVGQAIDRQYGADKRETFWQEAAEKRAVVLDDLHKLGKTRRAQEAAVDVLTNWFGCVVLLSSEDLRLEEVVSPISRDSSLWGFRQFNILQFGYALRYELVSKWCRLGRDYTDDEEAIERLIVRNDSLVSGILSANFIPSLPVFVLILLQKLESSTRLPTESGSFGYLYEVLVTASLSRNVGPGFDLETKYNYLGEFAHHLFIRGRRALPEAEVRRWHQWYCDTYKLDIDYTAFWGELSLNGAMDSQNGEYLFKYKYLYYFFVARYLRDHIREEPIREGIRQLSSQLHNEESASIMMFLCHLSKDESIIGSMLEAARVLLADTRPFDIEADVAHLNSLIKGLPSLVLGGGSAEANRRAERERLDKLEGRSGNGRQSREDDSIAEIATATELSWTAGMKTIQILGQVLKNFAGSLKGPQKAELVQECYDLGLRLIAELFRRVEGGMGDWGVAIRDRLASRSDPITAENVLLAANNSLFVALQFITFGLFKYMSDSAGTERISQTLTEVSEGGKNKNASIKVFDLSIRLDHYRHFPQSQIDELARQFSNNWFALGVVRFLVWYHFHLYTVDYKVKQKACSKLDISFDSHVKSLRPGRQITARKKHR